MGDELSKDKLVYKISNQNLFSILNQSIYKASIFWWKQEQQDGDFC